MILHWKKLRLLNEKGILLVENLSDALMSGKYSNSSFRLPFYSMLRKYIH
jgi:hypothetical protein